MDQKFAELLLQLVSIKACLLARQDSQYDFYKTEVYLLVLSENPATKTRQCGQVFVNFFICLIPFSSLSKL